MKNNLIIAGFCLLTLAVYWYFSGENAFSIPPRPSKVESLTFKTGSIKKKYGDCQTENSKCFFIELDYPVAMGGADSVAERINDLMRLAITLQIGFSSEGDIPSEDTNIEEMLDDYGDSFKDFLEEFPEYEHGWALEMSHKIGFQNDKIVSIQLENYSYMGGAHPNGYVEIYNFDVQTGKMLELSELIADVTALLPIAEKYFRIARELTPDAELSEGGFYFEENRFALPINIGVDGGDLLLYYNPYEVGAYALGPTEVRIPAAELAKLRKNW